MSSDEESLQYRAFDVKDLQGKYDPKTPAKTAEEYIYSVIVEKSELPQVAAVPESIRKQYKNKIDLIFNENKELRSDLAPCYEWQLCQVADFSNVRQKIERMRNKKHQIVQLPSVQDEEYWRKVCCDDDNTESSLPLLKTVLSMSEMHLEQLLEYFGEWLDNGFSSKLGKWIYSVMACIAIPLAVASYASLRNIARSCKDIRSKKTSSDDPDVAALNLIICLVAKYFGQTDLADE